MFFKIDSRNAWVNLDHVTSISHEQDDETIGCRMYILGESGCHRLTRDEYTKLIMILPVATPFAAQATKGDKYANRL